MIFIVNINFQIGQAVENLLGSSDMFIYLCVRAHAPWESLCSTILMIKLTFSFFLVCVCVWKWPALIIYCCKLILCNWFTFQWNWMKFQISNFQKVGWCVGEEHWKRREELNEHERKTPKKWGEKNKKTKNYEIGRMNNWDNGIEV